MAIFAPLAWPCKALQFEHKMYHAVARVEIGQKYWVFKIWRRGWDLNPRLSFPNTRFPSVLLKPLGHLSVMGTQPTRKAVRHRALSYGFRLAAVEIDQRTLQQSALRRQHERGKVCHVLRLSEPHNIRLPNGLRHSRRHVATQLLRRSFQKRSKAVRVHPAGIDRIDLYAVANAD